MYWEAFSADTLLMQRNCKVSNDPQLFELRILEENFIEKPDNKL